MTLQNMSRTRANNAKITKSQSDGRHKSLNRPKKSPLCEFLIFKYKKFCVKMRFGYRKNMGIFLALSLAVCLKVYYLMSLFLVCKRWWKYSSPLVFSIYFIHWKSFLTLFLSKVDKKNLLLYVCTASGTPESQFPEVTSQYFYNKPGCNKILGLKGFGDW